MILPIREWRRAYNKVQALSMQLREAEPDKDGNPPINPLRKYQKRRIQDEIEEELIKIGKYLDYCGIKNRPALWIYNKDDRKTWRSHESFKYDHLLL